jgi:hypothetical protein
VLEQSATGISITVETAVEPAMAAAYFRLYRETFGALETLAVARQLLHEHEFLEEMRDPRVHKYVAWDDQGEPIGMSTLTSDLETVPWISPGYFAHHFPEHTARRAVYYLGFTLVDHRRRQSRVFRAMVERIVERLVAERAVCAWDICAHNDDLLGLNDNIDRILSGCADVTVVPIDRQTYYAGTFHGPPHPPA